MAKGKPHYFAVGLFVIVTAALGLVGTVLLSSDALRSPKYFIETYVDESVQGIEVGTPFKFRGVKVGNVSEIGMVSGEYDTEYMYVMIRVALNDKNLLVDAENLPERIGKQVSEGLRLKMVPQGITGLSFLEADFYPDSSAEPLSIDWEPKYTYIPSIPATLTLVMRSVERIATDLGEVDLKAIGNNIEMISSNLNLTVAHMELVTGHAAGVSDRFIDNASLASEQLPSVSTNLASSMVVLEKLMRESDSDVEDILSNLRYTTDELQGLIRMIRRYPGILLSEPPKDTLRRGDR